MVRPIATVNMHKSSSMEVGSNHLDRNSGAGKD